MQNVQLMESKVRDILSYEFVNEVPLSIQELSLFDLKNIYTSHFAGQSLDTQLTAEELAYALNLRTVNRDIDYFICGGGEYWAPPAPKK
jgi:hypothetical protein